MLIAISESETIQTFCILNIFYIKIYWLGDFAGGSLDKNPPTNAGDTCSIMVWEDSTGFRAIKPMLHNY